MISATESEPVAVLAAAVLAAWLYLALGRGGFWKTGPVTRPSRRLPHTAPELRVAVIIPARNEAGVIARTIESLLFQNHSGPLHIFVVDDNSTDGTARNIPNDERVTVVHGEPLPAGWTGKMWAVAQGVERAREFRPDYILLTDGDIVHAYDNVRSLVARAESGELDLVSLMVRLHCKTLPERLLIPAFVFFFFLLYPPLWVADKRKDKAAAAGGCMLVRPAALLRIGGIEAIRGELIDDCALAREIKKTRGGISLGLAVETSSTREYRTFGEIRDMIARTAFTELRYSRLRLAGAVAGLVFLYLTPPVLGLAGHAPALVAWAVMTGIYLPMLLYYRVSPLWAPLLPAVAVFYLAATVTSAMRYWQGKGGQWKGRSQAGG